ncbi:MAG: ECF transporter S component, partial [Pisciglobus halotolerans]|nr:ECF transporter S component [Pisciglobus halotolerans]
MGTNSARSTFSVHRIALLGLLTALCSVSRVLFQFLPNVQPVTVFLISITLKMTMTDGWIVAILSILLTNLQLGLGVWTIAQIFSFSALILLTGLVIRPFFNRIPFLLMAIYSGFTGYLYGFLISAVQAPFFGIANFWPYYLVGIPYD